MGSSTSSINQSQKNFDNFYDIIDYIATYYILTMDFKSLSKLSEKTYCDKLVVLTSDIIDRYFTDMDVTYLAQRIKQGVEVNQMKSEKLIFINKDNLDGMDVANDEQKSIRKKRVCIGIAKFYVKIAHIFSAIVMTINPVYTYKDATGSTVKTTLLEKDKIPKGVNRKLYKLNICDNRIRALKRGDFTNNNTNNNENVTIQPKVCDINSTKNGSEKTLADEPGIPELMRLYLDDNYDYSTGLFNGMSKETEKQFRKDLALFYTAFTGNTKMPDSIQKFSDIKLRDYNKKTGCQQPIAALKNKYTLNKKDDLFIKYADNIKKMIQSASENQFKLLDVINDLFTYVTDPYSGKRVIRINPKLTDESLQKAIEKTRKYIVNLYIKCENDYVVGVQLFEAIVESKIIETTEKQIEHLKKEANKIISQTKETAQIVKENPDPININPNIKSNPINNPAAVPEPEKKVNNPVVVPENPTANNPAIEKQVNNPVIVPENPTANNPAIEKPVNNPVIVPENV